MELARAVGHEVVADAAPARPVLRLRVVADTEPPPPLEPRRSERLRVIGRARDLDEASAAALALAATAAPLPLTRAEEWELRGRLPRPKTRADCANTPRPCPWVTCRHHLYLDVHQGSGSIKLNHPYTEVHELKESCALDVADRGPASYADIGRHLNVTLERVRQLEQEAINHSQERITRSGQIVKPTAQPARRRRRRPRSKKRK